MKSYIKASFIVVALIFLAGCEINEASRDDSDDAAGETTKVVDVAKLDKSGDAEMADPTKAEAREWLKTPSNAVFGCSKDSVIKFVDEVYAAGAVAVYVTGIESMGGSNVTASLLLVMPKDAAARAKVIDISNRFGETVQNDPSKDIGQKYLSFGLD